MLRSMRLLALSLILGSLGSGQLFGDELYWTDKNDGTIWRGSMDGTSMSETLLDSRDGLVEPRGLGLDVDDNKMYWADAGTGQIRRANLDGLDIQTLVTGLPFVADLELDVGAGKMYWAETGSRSIRCANLDGSSPAVLFPGQTAPYYLELDIPGGMMYWGEGSNTKIFRGRMDGTGLVEEFVTGLNRVRDIGLDLANNMIYWNERDLHQVKRMEIGGGASETLFTDLNAGKPHGMALDLDDDMIYWTTTGSDSIMRSNMDGSGDAELLYMSPGAPWDIELAFIPEPSTMTLAGVAAVGMLTAKRRRRAVRA
jgi:hypothetical protein